MDQMTTMDGTVGEVDYRICYDGGWCIEYTDSASGVTLASSALIAHPDVPRRRDAVVAIERMARRYARELQSGTTAR